jgi:hypothetical protein
MTVLERSEPRQGGREYWGLVGDPFYQALIGEKPLVTKADRRDYLDDVWRLFIIRAGTGSAV